MNILELLLLSASLAADCVAVSMACGAANRHIRRKTFIHMAILFGLFQGIMPLIGYVFSLGVINFIVNFDHWIAFVLLGAIGGKMVWEANEPIDGKHLCYKRIILLALATSMDALVVGFTLTMVRVNMFFAVSVIALVTFALTLIGAYIGKKKLHFMEIPQLRIMGGLAIIFIGSKILIDHLTH